MKTKHKHIYPHPKREKLNVCHYYERINSIFKYHISCTEGKISVRINLLVYLYLPPSFHLTVVCYCPVGQETEVTSTPTRPVENVVLTTKGLQERNIQVLDGTTVENKVKQ